MREIQTSRFGALQIEQTDVIRFPRGIFGMEDLHDWVLLADTQNAHLGWLQSLQRAEVALAVVSPRRFVPDYRLRVSRRELDPVNVASGSDAHVLVILGKDDDHITLNLKAPLIINLARRLGCQVVAKGEQPLQHKLPRRAGTLRKSA